MNEYLEQYGDPVFYDSIEEYVLNDKRSYREVLASVETSLTYMNNHLGNIDKHLERGNNKLSEHDKAITKNSTWVIALRWMVYILFIALIGTVTTGVIGVW